MKNRSTMFHADALVLSQKHRVGTRSLPFEVANRTYAYRSQFQGAVLVPANGKEGQRLARGGECILCRLPHSFCSAIKRRIENLFGENWRVDIQDTTATEN